MFAIKLVFNFENGTLKFKSEIRFSENSADNLYTYFSCHIRSTRQLIIEMGALYRDRYRW